MCRLIWCFIPLLLLASCKPDNGTLQGLAARYERTVLYVEIGKNEHACSATAIDYTVVVTCAHCLVSEQLKVNGQSASVQYSDIVRDVAVLRTQEVVTDTYLVLWQGKVRQGDFIGLLGYLDGRLAYSFGVISGIAHFAQGEINHDIILGDISSYPGESGAPLFNAYGWIGMNEGAWGAGRPSGFIPASVIQPVIYPYAHKDDMTRPSGGGRDLALPLLRDP